jgi:hypothetical protein
LQPGHFIELTAGIAEDYVGRGGRVHLALNVAERVVILAVEHGPGRAVDDIAHGTLMIPGRPLPDRRRARKVLVSEDVVDAWAVQVAMSQDIRGIELEIDVVAIVDILFMVNNELARDVVIVAKSASLAVVVALGGGCLIPSCPGYGDVSTTVRS